MYHILLLGDSDLLLIPEMIKRVCHINIFFGNSVYYNMLISLITTVCVNINAKNNYFIFTKHQLCVSYQNHIKFILKYDKTHNLHIHNTDWNTCHVSSSAKLSVLTVEYRKGPINTCVVAVIMIDWNLDAIIYACVAFQNSDEVLSGNCKKHICTALNNSNLM